MRPELAGKGGLLQGDSDTQPRHAVSLPGGVVAAEAVYITRRRGERIRMAEVFGIGVAVFAPRLKYYPASRDAGAAQHRSGLFP